MAEQETTPEAENQISQFLAEVKRLTDTSAFILILAMNDTASESLILTQMENPGAIVKQEKLNLLNKVNEALDRFIKESNLN